MVTNMLGRGEMIRMSVSFQNPLQLPAIGSHIVNQLVRGAAAQGAGFGLEIQHRVNHCGLTTDRIGQNIAHGTGSRIKKRLDMHHIGGHGDS